MPKKDIKYMLRATIVSLSCNIVLFVIKATVLLIVNSLAIAVDLGITFVGLIVSVILFYSIKLSDRLADLFHNYGYGKVENVCEALEGVVLLGIALAMSSQAITHLLHPKDLDGPWIGFAASLVNAVINFGGTVYILKMAKKSKSPAIYAEGIHYKMEGFISGFIALSFLIDVFLSRAGYGHISEYIDPATALLVSAFLVFPSYRLAKKAFVKLLDSSVEEDSQMEILKQLTKHINEFCEFKNLRTRTSGRTKFVEFTVIVPEDLPVRKGHKITSSIESDIQESISNSEISIKMEPCQEDCEYVKKKEKCPYL